MEDTNTAFVAAVRPFEVPVVRTAGILVAEVPVLAAAEHAFALDKLDGSSCLEDRPSVVARIRVVVAFPDDRQADLLD